MGNERYCRQPERIQLSSSNENTGSDTHPASGTRARYRDLTRGTNVHFVPRERLNERTTPSERQSGVGEFVPSRNNDNRTTVRCHLCSIVATSEDRTKNDSCERVSVVDAAVSFGPPSTPRRRPRVAARRPPHPSSPPCRPSSAVLARYSRPSDTCRKFPLIIISGNFDGGSR